MNTVTEIKAELAKMVAAMAEKGVVTPEAQIQIKDTGRFVVHVGCKYETRPFNGENYFVTVGGTAAEAIEEANAFIATLPSPEDAVKHEFLTRVASAIDYATVNSIGDEYVAPLRGVSTAMTDNLLTHRKETDQ